jgi:hypothetical protein
LRQILALCVEIEPSVQASALRLSLRSQLPQRALAARQQDCLPCDPLLPWLLNERLVRRATMDMKLLVAPDRERHAIVPTKDARA